MTFRCAMTRQTPAGEEVTFVSADRKRQLVLVTEERGKFEAGKDYELPPELLEEADKA